MEVFISGGRLFLHLVPGDTLNILIDMKLIFRRQESPQAFVTLTVVVRTTTGPVTAGLKRGYPHFPASHRITSLHKALVIYVLKQRAVFFYLPLLPAGTFRSSGKHPSPLYLMKKFHITVPHCFQFYPLERHLMKKTR